MLSGEIREKKKEIDILNFHKANSTTGNSIIFLSVGQIRSSADNAEQPVCSHHERLIHLVVI